MRNKQLTLDTALRRIPIWCGFKSPLLVWPNAERAVSHCFRTDSLKLGISLPFLKNMRGVHCDVSTDYRLASLSIYNKTNYAGTDDRVIWNWNAAGTPHCDKEYTNQITCVFHRCSTIRPLHLGKTNINPNPSPGLLSSGRDTTSRGNLRAVRERERVESSRWEHSASSKLRGHGSEQTQDRRAHPMPSMGPAKANRTDNR